METTQDNFSPLYILEYINMIVDVIRDRFEMAHIYMRKVSWNSTPWVNLINLES